MRRGKPTLVHCAAGIQRTGGVLAVYQMLVRRESPDKISANLTERGFWKHPVNDKLVVFLDDHMQQVAELLASEGTIDQTPQPLPAISRSHVEMARRQVESRATL
jgi:hypothetical protein